MPADNKTNFQYRILKKYGVLPVFNGEVAVENVKSPLRQGETFHNWCDRVIKKNSNEVFLYGLYQPAGQKHIENLKEGGNELLEIIRSQAKRLLQRKAKIRSQNLEIDFEFDNFSDFEEGLSVVNSADKNIWYERLKNIKDPECLKNFQANDHTLFTHLDYEEFSEKYGSAAKYCLILNDISQYAEELSVIFSDGCMNGASESADDLVQFIQSSSEIDALEAELTDAVEADRERIEREHVKLFLGPSLCHELYEMIDDIFLELKDDFEALSHAEKFIGNLLIEKPRSTLKDCVDFLFEI